MVPQKVKKLPHDPAIALKGIFLREWKTYVHYKNLSMNVHRSIFRIVKKWEALKCPSADEWIDKMWPIHTTGC